MQPSNNIEILESKMRCAAGKSFRNSVIHDVLVSVNGVEIRVKIIVAFLPGSVVNVTRRMLFDKMIKKSKETQAIKKQILKAWGDRRI